MFHLHIYLHKKLPFLSLSFMSNEEVLKYAENKINYKGADLYEFSECKVCQNPNQHRLYWLKK